MRDRVIPRPFFFLRAARLFCDLEFFHGNSERLKQGRYHKERKQHRFVHIRPLGRADIAAHHLEADVTAQIHRQPEDEHLDQCTAHNHDAEGCKQDRRHNVDKAFPGRVPVPDGCQIVRPLRKFQLWRKEQVQLPPGADTAARPADTL